MRYGHAAFLMVHLKRLAVTSVAGPGGGVADVADGDAARRECLEDLGGKDVPYKPQVFMRDEDPVVVADYAAAFLASVLQRVQSVADRVGGIYRPRRKQAEYSAFFMDAHSFPPCERSSAARTRPTNSGCGRLGRLLNSGWNCTPT